MNNVTFIPKITDIKTVKLVPIDAVHQYITSDKLTSITSALRMISRKTTDMSLTPEERNAAKVQYETEKNKLPSIVFSGEFTERNNSSCTLYWARAVLDIDNIPDEKTLVKIKEYFRELPYTIMIFKSPSGYGLKIVVRITYKGEPNIIQFHNQAVTALIEVHNKQLKKYNVEIDPSGKDLARTCYLCYDKTAYFNEKAEEKGEGFSFTYKEAKPIQTNTTYKKNDWYSYIAEKSVPDNISLVEDMLSFCESNNIDLTDTYDKWLTVMWALKQSLGDEGYEYFVSFSKNYKQFNEEEVKKKWSENKIDPNKPKVTLGSLVYLCKHYGYEIDKKIRNKEYLWNSFIDKLITEDIYIRYDEDSAMLQIKKGDVWKLFTDVDEDYIRIGLLTGKIAKQDMISFINTICPKIKMHLEFINSLPEWDEKDRLTELADTLETEGEFPIKYMYIRKWFVGAVAQLHNDGLNGLRNENIIILTGPQYTGKSRWCHRLLPEEWHQYYTTKNLDLSQKDDNLLLSNKYIIFFDEGLSLRKNDIRALKTLLSSDKYTGRQAYGRHNRDYIRFCSFIGSTNDEQILSDDTGNRRYWVIPITKINADHNIDMCQVWSQALHLYRNNEQYWLTENEFNEIKEVNKSFETEDIIEDLLIKYLEPGNNSYTTTDILEHIIANEGRSITSELSVYRIGRILKKLGYKRVVKRSGNNLKHVYLLNFVSTGIQAKEMGKLYKN